MKREDESKFKFQVWNHGEPIVLCETLAEAESRKSEYEGDYIEWVVRT